MDWIDCDCGNDNDEVIEMGAYGKGLLDGGSCYEH